MVTQCAPREHILLPHLHDSLRALPAPHADQQAPPCPCRLTPRAGGEAKTPDLAPVQSALPLPTSNALSERPIHGVSRGQREDSVRAHQSPYIGNEDALTESALALSVRASHPSSNLRHRAHFAHEPGMEGAEVILALEIKTHRAYPIEYSLSAFMLSLR